MQELLWQLYRSKGACQRRSRTKRMAQDARSPQPTQTRCERSGVLWDLGAESMPPAIFFNGPVIRVQPGIESKVCGAGC